MRKTTEYFETMRLRSDRKDIEMAWIEHVIENPESTQIQVNGRVRKWAKIPQTGRYLRVVLLPDGATLHNAFFDRGFRL